MSEDMAINHARMEMQQELRRINREIIHDMVPELGIKKLSPLFHLVAKARGLYIKKLIEISEQSSNLPTDAQVKELSLLRRSYEELLSGGHMIETAIERGYIDVEEK